MAEYTRKSMLSFGLTTAAPLDIFFVDDACQMSPRRPGMGPLVAMGGIRVAADILGLLNRELERLCRTKYHFPAGEEFKWNVPKNSWMAKRLTARRQQFYRDVLKMLGDHHVVATVIIADAQQKTAIDATKRKVTKYYLERASQQCERRATQGFIIVDQPGGGTKEAATLRQQCIDVIEWGTAYVLLTHIAHGPLLADSKTSRLLQAADLLTSCVLAAVSGHEQYSLPLLADIVPLLDQHEERRHGFGIKITPDDRYMNLYFWLFDETRYWHGGTGRLLPYPFRRYCDHPMTE